MGAGGWESHTFTAIIRSRIKKQFLNLLRRCVHEEAMSLLAFIMLFLHKGWAPNWMEILMENFKVTWWAIGCSVFGYRCNQLPLIERLPQWLSGPSPPLPDAAGPLDGYRTRSKWCSEAQWFLFNYRHRWHKCTKRLKPENRKDPYK